MHHLSGHANMVTVLDAFETEEFVHIVMELCDGGCILEKVIDQVRDCNVTELQQLKQGQYATVCQGEKVIEQVRYCIPFGFGRITTGWELAHKRRKLTQTTRALHQHTQGAYCEADAAALIHSLLEMVAYSHDMGVVHRDIKVR